jgi:hypothetical protein
MKKFRLLCKDNIINLSAGNNPFSGEQGKNIQGECLLAKAV